MKFNTQILVIGITIFSGLLLQISCQKCYAPAVYSPIIQATACIPLDSALVSDYIVKTVANKETVTGKGLSGETIHTDCLHTTPYRDLTKQAKDGNSEATINCARKNRFSEIYTYAGKGLDNAEGLDYLNSAKFTGGVVEVGAELQYSETAAAGGFIAATNAPLGDYRLMKTEFPTVQRDNTFALNTVTCGDYETEANKLNRNKPAWSNCYSGNKKNPMPEGTIFEKDNTMLAFYQNLKKYNINYIVQLTNFVEQAKTKDLPSCKCKVKADRYFADALNAEFIVPKADYTASTAKVKTLKIDKTKFVNTEIRDLEFTDIDGKKHLVQHIHFRAWIDFSVPEDTPTEKNQASLLNVVSFIRAQKDAGKNTIVHCTGGIGRTGTFISSVLTSKLPSKKKFNLVKFILTLRERRPEFVETDGQVNFIMKNIFLTANKTGRKLKNN